MLVVQILAVGGLLQELLGIMVNVEGEILLLSENHPSGAVAVGQF